jgi:hypothetical protein
MLLNSKYDLLLFLNFVLTESSSCSGSSARYWPIHHVSAIYIRWHLSLHQPGVYMKIMPPWLPFPEVIVYVSGAAEIILGVASCINPGGEEPYGA